MPITHAVIDIKNHHALLQTKVFGLSIIDRMVFTLHHSAGIKAIYLDPSWMKPKYKKRGISCLPLSEYQKEIPSIMVDIPAFINMKFINELTTSHHKSVIFSELKNIKDDYTVFHQIHNQEHIKEGKVKLRIALRKEKDTLLAFLFNRAISTRISVVIATWLPFISPNMISVFALILGLSAFGILISASSYSAGVVAGVFYYLASLFDGVDGEIARIKFQFSRFGLWLDNVTDELLNFLLIIGASIFSYHLLGDKIFKTLAIISVTLFIVTKVIQLISIIFKLQPEDISQFKLPHMEGSTMKSQLFNKTVLILSNIPRSDMMRFLLMVFAILNQIPFYSYGISLFSVVFFIGVVLSTIQEIRKRS